MNPDRMDAQSGSSLPRRECFAFLRALPSLVGPDRGVTDGDLTDGDLVATRPSAVEGAGGAAAEHSAVCRSCAARLRAARRLAGLLRQPPSVPQRVREPGFLAGIHERVVAEFESAPLGSAVEAELSVISSAPRDAEILVPGVERRSMGAQIAAAAPALPVPGWLWARVRQRVMEERKAASRQALRGPYRVRKLALVVVTTAAAAVLALTLLPRHGTQIEPQIVFVDVTTMPAVDFAPLVALRNGGVR